jgi:hypothetical protein
MPVCDGTGHDCCIVALCVLHETAASCGKVIGHGRSLQGQPCVVDDIDVGLETGLEQSAIEKADG